MGERAPDNAAVDAHRDDPTFGYRFIADDLRAAGLLVSERRVWRLCSQQRLWSLHAKKRGPTRKEGPPVHDDRVRRAFTAPDLDKLWLTDITEHDTGEGKLYLCAVKDACSYSIDSRMRSSLAVAALQMAIARRGPLRTVVHSDRGSQFRSKKFVRALSDAGLLGSMGRVAEDAAADFGPVTVLEETVDHRVNPFGPGRSSPSSFDAFFRIATSSSS